MERLDQLKKKQEERSQMNIMMDACEKMRMRKEADRQKEKEEDVQIQKAYIEILEK